MAGAAGEGWASGDCDEMAQEERIEDPQPVSSQVLEGTLEVLIGSCGSVSMTVTREETGVRACPGCPRVDHWERTLSEGDGDDVQRSLNSTLETQGAGEWWSPWRP